MKQNQNKHNINFGTQLKTALVIVIVLVIVIEIVIVIDNGNRTELSPIRSVIIRVINEIRGRPICLITSMITD